MPDGPVPLSADGRCQPRRAGDGLPREQAWESLCQWRQTLRGRKRKAADRLINYVVEHRDMINYPEFVQKEWDIGSGPTESRCKIATRRLKHRSARWGHRRSHRRPDHPGPQRPMATILATPQGRMRLRLPRILGRPVRG